MHTSTQRTARGGLTLVELVVTVLVLALVAALLPLLRGVPPRAAEEAHRIRCRNNLNQIAKAMGVYLAGPGGSVWYPVPLGRGQTPGDYNGAEWLAALYWTGAHPDPGIFICPVSGDSNDDGLHLGTTRATPGLFGSQTVSYAGMHYRSLRDEDGSPVAGAIADDYPPNKPMASDDTQGDVNHGTLNSGGLSVLFFDSHVEFRTSLELHLTRAVGDTDPDALLRDLRN